MNSIRQTDYCFQNIQIYIETARKNVRLPSASIATHSTHTNLLNKGNYDDEETFKGTRKRISCRESAYLKICLKTF